MLRGPVPLPPPAAPFPLPAGDALGAAPWSARCCCGAPDGTGRFAPPHPAAAGSHRPRKSPGCPRRCPRRPRRYPTVPRTGSSRRRIPPPECSARRYRAVSPPPGCPRRRRRRGPAAACAGSPSAAFPAVASAPRRPRNRRRRRWPPGRAETVAAAAAAAAGAAEEAAAGAGTAAGAGPAAAAAAGPRSASVSDGAAASCRPPPPPPRCCHRRCPSHGCPRSRRPPRPRCSASSSLTAEGAAQGTRRHRRAQGAMGTWGRRAHAPGRTPAGRAGASLTPAPPARLTWGRTDTYRVGLRSGPGALRDAVAAERRRQRPAGRRGLSRNTEVSPSGGGGSSSLHSGPQAPPHRDTDIGHGPPPPLLSAAPGRAAGSG